MPVEFLDLPPADAVRHFRAKGVHVGFGWRSTAAEAHAVSFTVAKAMRFDILRDLHAAVDRAQAEGVPFREFVADLKPRLQRLGWWGRQKIRDPRTGETAEVLIGPRRLRTIFDANLASSAAAGQWQRIERVKDTRPYLRYSAVQDGRTRPEHLAWHGVILPVDHEFWNTHFPPNGWRCRCVVTQLSEDDLTERGWEVSKDPEIKTRRWVNRRTRTVHQVPRGIDPGWERNVGKVDRVAAARALNREKFGDPAEAPRRPRSASPPLASEPGRSRSGPPETSAPLVTKALARTEHDDFIGEGRERRLEIERAAGIRRIATDADAGAFRAALIDRLSRERGAGVVEAAIVEGSLDAAVSNVKEAVRLLPAAWVARGNAYPIEVRRAETRSSYVPPLFGDGPMVFVRDLTGSALHEYVHHLQFSMGEKFNALWRGIYLRRTTFADGRRRPLEPWRPDTPDELVRVGGFFDRYPGREYPEDITDAMNMAPGDPVELATTHIQAVLADYLGKEKLRVLATKDREMLDFTLGMLLHFDP